MVELTWHEREGERDVGEGHVGCREAKLVAKSIVVEGIVLGGDVEVATASHGNWHPSEFVFLVEAHAT